MKTAEEHWNDFKFNKSHGAFIAAMKIYARQYAEEDRKDCAEKATTKDLLIFLEDEGKTVFAGEEVDKASILNRPLPELK